MILWVGIVIRLESSVIVKLCGFCTVSSENSDVLGSVCVSDEFGCRVSEIVIVVAVVIVLEENQDFEKDEQVFLVL